MAKAVIVFSVARCARYIIDGFCKYYGSNDFLILIGVLWDYNCYLFVQQFPCVSVIFPFPWVVYAIIKVISRRKTIVHLPAASSA